MKADGEPWEKRKGESRQSFQAWVIYRDQGLTRSAARVAKELGKSTTLISRWCTRDGWVVRAEAWDRHQDDEKRAAASEAIAEMNVRHAKLATDALEKVAARLTGGVTENGELIEALNPSDLTARELARLADVFSRLERLARGESESRITVEVGTASSPADYEAAQRLMSNPELVAQAEELAAKLYEDEDKPRHLRAVG